MQRRILPFSWIQVIGDLAARVFAAWVRQCPIAPADPNTLVRDIKVERYYWGRLHSEIATRTAVWYEGAYSNSHGALPTAPNPSAPDLWTTTPEELQHRSCHLAPCETCRGGGVVSCPDCAGKARVQCPNCQGTGKAYGYAKNGSRRLMNCRMCAGDLELRCSSCQSGQRACPHCSGSGRKVRWLELVQTSRTDVRVGPEDCISWLFPWKETAAQASPAEIGVDVIATGEVDAYGALSEAHLTKLTPAGWVEQHGRALQPEVQNTERVVRQVFSFYEVPCIAITYALAGDAPRTVRFEGLRMLGPPVNRDDAFAHRARRLQLIRNVLAGIALGIPAFYLARGEYYRSPAVAVLLVCVVAVTFGIYRLYRGLSLHGFAHSRPWAWFAGAGTLVLLASAVQAEPSLRTARQLLSQDQFEATSRELLALGNPQEPARAELWNSLHLAIAKKATAPELIRHELAEIAPGTPQRLVCAQRLGELVDKTAREHLAAGRWQEAETLLASVAADLQRELPGDPVLGRVTETRALTHEQAYGKCSTEVCRLHAARSALTYAQSPLRVQRLNASRQNVSESLTYRPGSGEAVLTRLKRLRAIENVVTELGVLSGDDELAARARTASETVRRERARVPLLGADSTVLVDLPRKRRVPICGSLQIRERNGDALRKHAQWSLHWHLHRGKQHRTARVERARSVGKRRPPAIPEPRARGVTSRRTSWVNPHELELPSRQYSHSCALEWLGTDGTAHWRGETMKYLGAPLSLKRETLVRSRHA
ncbi:MAG: zinc finger-like domain-containing protein [Polyangiaceae bacterium]